MVRRRNPSQDVVLVASQLRGRLKQHLRANLRHARQLRISLLNTYGPLRASAQIHLPP